jgi:hypothetical protein
MYFIAPSPPPQNYNNNDGQVNMMTGQQAAAAMMPPHPPQGSAAVQISPVMMGYAPGAFNQDPSLVSPPITPRRTTAPQS